MKTFNFSQLITSSGIGRECTESQSRYYRGNRRLYTYLNRTLVVLFAFLTLGAGEMRADSTVKGGYIYFDPSTSGWGTPSSVEYVISHDSYSCWYAMSKVANTKLYYISSASWGDAKYIAFTANSGWTSAEGHSYDHRKAYLPSGSKYTSKNTYGVNSGSTYLFYASNSNNDASITTSSPAGYKSGGYSDLNATQTIKSYVSINGAAYSNANSKATISLTSYKMSGNGTSTKQTGSISTSQKEGTISAARTATTTVSIGDDVASGYVFIGWYNTSGELLSSETSFTYYPTGATTIHARFATKYTPGTTIYLKANSNWAADNARFAAYFFGNTNTWSNFTNVSGDFYSVTVPAGDWGYVIVCRMNGGNQTNSWDNVWNQTEDIATPSGTENCIVLPGTITTGCSWRKYTEGSAICGDFNDWAPMANVMTGSTTKSVTFNLAANKSYAFKVAEGYDEDWWGYDNSTDYKLTYVSQTTSYTLAQGKHNMLLFTTATSGDYTFTWNTSDHTLSIGYPTVTHPCSDYIYFYNDQSWDPVALHAWGGEKGTVWGSNPALSSFTFDKKTYYYAAVGDNTGAIFGQGIDDSHKTADLTVSDGRNKFYKKSTTAGWYPFTATLKLDHQGATNTPAPNTITVTYNASTNLTGDVITTTPQNTGYTFGGYYTEIGGAGNQLIGSNENVVASVSGHTGAEKIWIKGPDVCSDTCYAKWSQSVPLDKENGESNGSVTLTYNSASHAAITNPTKANYTFGGWYSGDNGTGQLIINTSGTLQANKTDDVAFTGADGIWIHTGSAPTLHATWTQTITLDEQGATTSSITSKSVIYNSNSGLTTRMSPPAKSGYDFNGYYTEIAGGGSKLISNTGYWQASVSGYTDASKNWINEGAAPTIYAYWTQTVTLNANTAYYGESPNRSATATWNGTALSDITHTASATGYERKGYYTNQFGGTKVLNADGTYAATDVSGYITSGKWTKAGATTLYAQHNAKSYTVTLDKNGGNADGSVTTTYNQNTVTGFSEVSRTGYTCAGYYTAADGGSLILTAGGELSSTAVSTWLNTGGYWIKDGVDITLYAHWTPLALTFTASSNSNWSNASNWSPACVPTIEHDVTINKPVTVDITNARAKSVVLNQKGGNTGQLVLAAGQELVVATTVKKTTDGSNRLATCMNDIIFNSTAVAGLGALVMGSHDGTDSATVNYFSKSHGSKDSYASVVQYVGIPFGNNPTMLSMFYNSWTYETDYPDGSGNVYWKRLGGDDTMEAFRGYAVSAADNEMTPGHMFWMQGTLVASTNQTLSTKCHTAGDSGNTSYNNEFMLANSWMAPIRIGNFQASDFSNITATIYIFNAGSNEDYYKSSWSGDDPGQYSTYPINTYPNIVIPAMQSFSVYTYGSVNDDASLTLNYERLVYNPAIATGDDHAAITPNKAPQRTNGELAESEKMHLYVQGESGYRDMLYLLAHEHFTTGFDNGWDGTKLFGETVAPQLYSITPVGEMAVSCVPVMEGTAVGFRKGSEDESYTITFDYEGEQELYLNDLKADISTLIDAESSYAFIAGDNDDELRFVISATPLHKLPTGVDNYSQKSNIESQKLLKDGILYIIRNGRIYDATGVLLK